MEKWQASNILNGNLKALKVKFEDLNGITTITREDFERIQIDMKQENKKCIDIIFNC